MEHQFSLLRLTRQNILQAINSCTPAQLFTIPQGFNNHMLWHALHVVASQQVLIYGLSHTPFAIDQDIVTRYRNGTVPNQEVDPAMIEWARTHLLPTVDRLRDDYAQGVFGKDFKVVTTSYGATLASVEDAIRYNNVHEAMHYGQLKMLKQAVVG